MSQDDETPPDADEAPIGRDAEIEADGRPASFDRRAAIKKAGVGAGVAVGLVWTSPRIEGLSLRASYAQAASAPVGSTQSFAMDTVPIGSFAEAGAGPPAPHLAFGYNAAPPPPTDDSAPPTDDGAGFAPGPGLGPLAMITYPTTNLRITRSTDCPANLDLTWQDPTPTGINQTDSASTGGPYTITRDTQFFLSVPRRAAVVTFHFTC